MKQIYLPYEQLPSAIDLMVFCIAVSTTTLHINDMSISELPENIIDILIEILIIYFENVPLLIFYITIFNHCLTINHFIGKFEEAYIRNTNVTFIN